jgi:hypothetical protein
VLTKDRSKLFFLDSLANKSTPKNLELYEIIIVCDNINHLNRIQIITRIKKLLGIDIDVKIGEFIEFEKRIQEIISVKVKTQSFGDYNFKNKLV